MDYTKISKLSCGSRVQISNVFMSIIPQTMKLSISIKTFIRVATEKISLGLNKIGRQTFTSVLIKIV